VTPERERRIREVSARRQLDVAVVLENVHDPHNIAAVVRTCDAVGIQAVYTLFTDPEINTNRLRLGKRTTAGARKWVDTYLYTDVDTCIRAVRERCDALYATTLVPGAKSIYQADFTKSVALVFGNERDGISEELLNLTDGRIYIPQMGMVQSLNISVACAIALYEIFRQRNELNFYEENPTQSEAEATALFEDWVERHTTRYKGRSVKRR
jgi:tRNA (guanosine-2'-O-)-methyltransferase